MHKGRVNLCYCIGIYHLWLWGRRLSVPLHQVIIELAGRGMVHIQFELNSECSTVDASPNIFLESV